MLPDTVRDMAGRIGLPATLVVVEQLGSTSWRIAEGRAWRAKRAGLRWPRWWAATSSGSTHYLGAKKLPARCHKALVRWRDLEIVERFEQGLRDGQAARSLHKRSGPPVQPVRPLDMGRLSAGRASRHRAIHPVPLAGAQRPGRRLLPDPISPLNPFR
ncbi:hypothetical protein [Pseudomonas aeruginosa]|uniref:hypothetical protein n=1 Tax=Pseudomonas aeruginosa TaxID=287 RepID=UPI003D7F3A52